MPRRQEEHPECWRVVLHFHDRDWASATLAAAGLDEKSGPWKVTMERCRE